MILDEEITSLPTNYILPNGITQMIAYGRNDAKKTISNYLNKPASIFHIAHQYTFSVSKVIAKQKHFYDGRVEEMTLQEKRELFANLVSGCASAVLMKNWLKEKGSESYTINGVTVEISDSEVDLEKLYEIVPLIVEGKEDSYKTIETIKTQITNFEKDWWKTHNPQPQQSPLPPLVLRSPNGKAECGAKPIIFD